SYRWLTVISVLFVTCLITANIIAVKLIAIGPFVVPAGVIIFPVSYIFGDILTEVYGYSVARRVIWTGFLGNLLAVAAIWLAQVLPAASFWEGQRSYETILGYTPRLLAASFLAYLVGEFLNSFVLARMKTVTRGRWLWSRTIGSTLAGEGADSLVFITVAFFGAMAAGPLGAMVVTQWLFKVAYEVAATPLTYGAVAFLKRQEKVDSYDVGTKFNPFLIAE
ncbi:MAG: queuosine precursor transporter, partial [Chloroflexi bacterium]|nr:queuosine precursor transporter [Chloroflexota bacterium]